MLSLKMNAIPIIFLALTAVYMYTNFALDNEK